MSLPGQCWKTPTQKNFMVSHLDWGLSGRRPLRYSVAPGAPQTLHPATQGKRNWSPGGVQRARMKKHKDPPFCKASRLRILTGGGGVACFPLVITRSSPTNTSTDCYLINSLPGLSSADSQLLPSFIHSTNTKRSQPRPDFQRRPSLERD